MMAGLWGARNANSRESVARMGSEVVDATPRDYWDYDQVLIHA